MSTNCFSELVGRHQRICASFLPLVMNSRRECTERDASLQSICLGRGGYGPFPLSGKQGIEKLLPHEPSPSEITLALQKEAATWLSGCLLSGCKA